MNKSLGEDLKNLVNFAGYLFCNKIWLLKENVLDIYFIIRIMVKYKLTLLNLLSFFKNRKLKVFENVEI